MKYLSDHARIVVLEKKLRQLAAIVAANIAGSGRTLGYIGQMVESAPIPPEKMLETLTTGDLWEKPIDEKIAKETEAADLKRELRCGLNRLRNPKELS